MPTFVAFPTPPPAQPPAPPAVGLAPASAFSTPSVLRRAVLRGEDITLEALKIRVFEEQAREILSSFLQRHTNLAPIPTPKVRLLSSR